MTPAVAIVLARAGSKGLPGKNVAPVAGRPCVAWTIEAAQRASSVGLVALSTDDPRAAAVAREMGVVVIDRPPELAGDTATVDAAARHAVESLRDRMVDGRDASPVVILYGNVPVRPADLIDRAVGLLVESGCDSVQSYAPVGKHHPYWTARVEDGGRVRPWEGEVLNHGIYRRQELPPAFIPDGGVIAVTRRSLFCEVEGVVPGPHAFFGADRRGVLTGEGDVVDVDGAVDLAVADAMLRQRGAPVPAMV